MEMRPTAPQPVSCWSVCPGGTTGGTPGTIVCHLNSSTRYAFTPDSARRFAESLLHYADKADALAAAKVAR